MAQELSWDVILRDWISEGALWLMEEPDLVAKNWHNFEIAAEQATSLHADFLHDLAKLKDINIVWAVGDNPNTPPAALLELSTHEDACIRGKVAKHQNTPPETLALLARDEREEVQSAAVANPCTPEETLVWIAHNSASSLVLNSLASNRCLPPSIFAILLQRSEEIHMYNLARNASIPMEMLWTFVQDPKFHHQVLENPSVTMELLQHIASTNLDGGGTRQAAIWAIRERLKEYNAA